MVCVRAIGSGGQEVQFTVYLWWWPIQKLCMTTTHLARAIAGIAPPPHQITSYPWPTVFQNTVESIQPGSPFSNFYAVDYVYCKVLEIIKCLTLVRHLHCVQRPLQLPENDPGLRRWEIGQYLSCSSLTLFVFAMLTRSSYSGRHTSPGLDVARRKPRSVGSSTPPNNSSPECVVVLVWEARGYLRKWSSPTLSAVDAELHQRTDPITDNYLDKRRRENEKLIRVQS